MDMSQKFIFADTVFAQEVDGEMVLLDMESENYFGLDEVGTSIWQAMQEKETLQEVFDLMMETYDVEADVLQRDLFDFIGKLLEQGLIEAQEH